ncbi:hypothetical protein GEMRC1_003468 [Eukaryota sp. GEM-RC1]
MYLIRLFIRGALEQSIVSDDTAELFGETLTALLSDESVIPFGFQCHVCDVFPEEVETVFKTSPNPNTCLPFLYCFVICLSKCKNKLLRTEYGQCLNGVVSFLFNLMDEEEANEEAVVLSMSLSEILFYYASSVTEVVGPARKIMYDVADRIGKKLDIPLGSLSKLDGNANGEEEEEEPFPKAS